MIENVVGVYGLPLGIAQNFIVNGREVLVPMVIEEPSVVAGASFMARLARAGGGFFASADQPEMIGQMKGNAGIDPQQFIDTVPELKAPVLDRNPRLGKRHENVVDDGDLRHA